MRSWIFTFFILTILAGLVGFTDITGMIAHFSKTLFLVFGSLCIASFVYYLFRKKTSILSWTLIFLAISGITGVLAFSRLTDAVVDIAKISFYIFLVLFIISFVVHSIRKKSR